MSWGMEAAFIVKNGDTAETSIRQPLLTCLLVEFDSDLGSKILMGRMRKKMNQV